jgi:isopenicillin N synthase-like dioxygenase
MNFDQKTIQTIDDIPIIDLNTYLNAQDTETPEVKAVCDSVISSLHKYGILIVRDPRAKDQDNDEYIDLMEKYFDSRGKKLYSGETVEEFKPEYHF